jgi:hypothetical protein
LKSASDETGEWLQDFIQYAVPKLPMAAGELARFAKLYTYVEVEFLALEAVLKDKQLYVVGPTFEVWDFDFPVLERRLSFQSQVFADYATTIGSDFGFGCVEFINWKLHSENVDKLVSQNLEPWSRTFLEPQVTSPSLFLNFETGQIDLSVVDQVACISPVGGHFSKVEGYAFGLSDIRPFEGWFVCLKAADLDMTELQAEFQTKKAEIVCSLVFGEQTVRDLQKDDPLFLEYFVGAEINQAGLIRQTMANESHWLNQFSQYVQRKEKQPNGKVTKQELRTMSKKYLGPRAFDRVWRKLVELYPDLSKAGRPRKHNT